MTEESTLSDASVPRPVYTPQALQCPSCAGALQRFSEHTQLMVCDWCNERLELTHAELKALGKEVAPQFNQFTLELNSHFNWEGVRYTVIGRISFLDSESDPGPKDYLLFHPHLGTLWATEYWGYGYYITRTSRMLPPANALQANPLIMPDGSKWARQEVETYSIEHVDGALPWVAKQGDRVQVAEFLSASHRKTTMSIEQTIGVEEIECSISLEITEKEWQNAAGLTTRRTRKREQRGEFPAWARYSGLLIGGFVTLFLFMMWIATFAAEEDSIASFYYSTSQFQSGDPTQPIEIVTDTFDIVEGEFGLEPTSILFHSTIDNEWMSIQYALLSVSKEDAGKSYDELLQSEATHSDTEQSKSVFVSDMSLSYYHGYEGGESWSEGSRRAKERVLLPPGKYRLLLTAVAGNDYGAHDLDRGVTVSVLPNDVPNAFYGVGSLFTLLLTCLFLLED